MFKTFDNLDKLIAEVNHDRTFSGEGSATADRFPVRFVLFDNFRDCCEFVSTLFHTIANVQIKRIEDWMDAEYPDTMLTHKKLADNIQKLIATSQDQYSVIMPFSELARFYNNQPEKAEFNSLINTVKGFDTTAKGFANKQRIYIPIVGLEGKMQHFRDDSQSFIWYFQNADHQNDYRLVLTDNSLYDVQHVSELYHISDNVTSWLKVWHYPELKDHIICTSHAIFAHANYAQPDNAFTFCVCHNAYEFLTKGLRLGIDIEYKEEDSIYWEKLAKLVDIEHFKFETFFNEQFGIHDLADYKVFFQQWFQHKDNFMRWLLAKYYTHKFCDQGYICRVLQSIDSYTDTALVQNMARSIFVLEDAEQYIEQRAIGLKMAAQYGVEISKETQKYVIDKINEIEQTLGIRTAVKYLGTHSDEEYALIIKWYANGKLDKEELQTLYPDLYHYLNKTIIQSPEAWAVDYIDAYKEAKVRNIYAETIKSVIDDKNENEISHFKWTNQFETTRTILSERTDISHYLWIDGLGVDWVSFIQHIINEFESEGYYLESAEIATANLPTRTENNKQDILKLSQGLSIDKIGDLDEVAHSCRPYPQYIIDDLKMMRQEIESMLKAHAGEKIAIVSDHGISYLSQLCDGYNLKGFKSDHYGRVAEHSTSSVLVHDDKYTVLKDGKTVCALKHASLMAKIPEGSGCHGGATPEEQLVPIIIISPEKIKSNLSVMQRTYKIDESRPIFDVDIFGIDNNAQPVVEYNGQRYKMTKVSAMTYSSERINLVKGAEKITLIIGSYTKTFDVTIKMAVQENDLFGDIL